MMGSRSYCFLVITVIAVDAPAITIGIIIADSTFPFIELDF